MKKAIVLLILFAWAPVALAAHPPLTQTSNIPGLKRVYSEVIFSNSKRLLSTLTSAFRNRVDMSSPLAMEDIQCAMAKLGAGFAQDMMLNPPKGLSPDDIKGLPDAVAHYRALEEQFCRPPPGASVNRGEELVKLFIKRNTEGTSQAKSITKKYESRAEQLADDGSSVSAGQIALAVAIAVAILAKEAVPVLP
ncbi:hypothetical protein [Myxococcus faecalis]|uniref:hypothetical protein n=1 Tax=Myxococcus faecalis TaxID=3115646 RepID=UPI003CFABB57